MRKLTKQQVTLYTEQAKRLHDKKEFHKIFELSEQLFNFIDIIKEATIISSAYYQSLVDKDILRQEKLKTEILNNINKYFVSFEVNTLNMESVLWYYKMDSVSEEGIKHTRVKTRTNAKTTLKVIQNILYLEDSEKYKDLIIKINSYIDPKKNLNNSLPNISLPKIKEKKKAAKKEKISKATKRQLKKQKLLDTGEYYLEIRSSSTYCYIEKYPMLKLSKKVIRERKRTLLRQKQKSNLIF